MKFLITIEEMLTKDFEVEAEDIYEAMKIAEKNYHNGKFVLEPGNLVAKQMSGCNEFGKDCTEWVEF